LVESNVEIEGFMEKNRLESSTLSFAGKTEEKTSDMERQDKIQGGFTETDSLAKARKRGGQVCVEKYGTEHYRRMGKKGGDATKQRHDAEYYRRIGAMGREARRKKKRERQAHSFSLIHQALEEERKT
jgi:hypothetical protein